MRSNICKFATHQPRMPIGHWSPSRSFCPGVLLVRKFNEIYRTYFTKNFPARAFIGSGPLLRGGHFEMQGIAIRR
jgi:hypothetical protein